MTVLTRTDIMAMADYGKVRAERRREIALARIGGFEESMFIRFGGHEVAGVAEDDIDRTTADGRASSVQFVKIPFTDAHAAGFKSGAGEASSASAIRTTPTWR